MDPRSSNGKAQVRTGNAKPARRKPRTNSADQRKWQAQIPRSLKKQHGFPLPNGDAERKKVVLWCHACFAGLRPETIARRIPEAISAWANWMLPEVAALIDEVTNRPRHVSRKKLGIGLGLTQAVRMDPAVRAKDIWPIDLTHKEWVEDCAKKARDRSADNYAMRKATTSPAKPITMKARAMRFLTTILTNGPMPVAEIMRLAVGMRLQRKGATKPSEALRDARIALGIEWDRSGWQGAVIWSLPTPVKSLISPLVATFSSQPPVNRPQVIDIPIGGHFSSGTTVAATSGANHQRPTARMDRKGLGDDLVSLDAPPPTTGTNSVAAKEVELADTGTGEIRLKVKNACFWRIGDAVGTVPIRTRDDDLVIDLDDIHQRIAELDQRDTDAVTTPTKRENRSRAP